MRTLSPLLILLQLSQYEGLRKPLRSSERTKHLACVVGLSKIGYNSGIPMKKADEEQIIITIIIIITRNTIFAVTRESRVKEKH